MVLSPNNSRHNDYRDGLESAVRTISLAPPDKRSEVFEQQAAVVAGYVRSGGLDKVYAAERLNNAAMAFGLIEVDGHDAVQAKLAKAMAPAVPSKQPTAQARQRLTPITWAEIHKLPKREALVCGLLDRGAMSVVYGGSNTGKTFFALDLSVCIALHKDWWGRQVRHGAVVYIAAEGGLGIEERLTAYRRHHNVKAEGTPLYIIPESIDLCRAEADVILLLQRIGELPKSPPLELIVIDTLSRAMAGGNENSSDDMGRFVAHCDRLRKETGAHVLIIHHAGKDDSRGARGHSLLKAAADTEIFVTKNQTTEETTATVVKQRDSVTGGIFGFKLFAIEIGKNEDKAPITSCVVVPFNNTATLLSARKGPRLARAAEKALRALAEAISERGSCAPASNLIPAGAKVVTVDEWRDYAYRAGISTGAERAKQQAFKRAFEFLVAGGYLEVLDNQVWLTVQNSGEQSNTL